MVFFETISDHGHGVVQPGSNRAERDIQDDCDLGVRKILSETQVENFTLQGRKLLDHLASRVDPRITSRVDRNRFDRDGFRYQRVPRFPAPGCQAHVPGHAEEVGPEMLGLLPPLQTLHHLQESFLHEVVGHLLPFVTARKIADEIGGRLPEELFEIG